MRYCTLLFGANNLIKSWKLKAILRLKWGSHIFRIFCISLKVVRELYLRCAFSILSRVQYVFYVWRDVYWYHITFFLAFCSKYSICYFMQCAQRPFVGVLFCKIRSKGRKSKILIKTLVYFFWWISKNDLSNFSKSYILVKVSAENVMNSKTWKQKLTRILKDLRVALVISTLMNIWAFFLFMIGIFYDWNLKNIPRHFLYFNASKKCFRIFF